VDMRRLRNPGYTHQQHAKERSHTQPQRLRYGASSTLGQGIHANPSMTRFLEKQTQSRQKCTIASRHAAHIVVSPSAHA
jgi:hypothetical protein